MTGYLLILTDRYPDTDPCDGPWVVSDRPHPITLTVDDDLRRSRLMVFFRLPLAVPHLVWLTLWGIVGVLRRDRELVHHPVPRPPPRRCTASSRPTSATRPTSTRSSSWRPTRSGLHRPAGSYPVDVEIAPPERQNRWITGFRLMLAFPAFLLGGALGGVGFVAAIFGWFVALFTGRMPLGLRNIVIYSLRYGAQCSDTACS